MRRVALAAALVGAGVLAVRTLAPRLHARMAAACERMFDEMPDSFPPKRMLGGIDEIRTSTARTLEILEDRERLDAASLDDALRTSSEEVEVVVA